MSRDIFVKDRGRTELLKPGNQPGPLLGALIHSSHRGTTIHAALAAPSTNDRVLALLSSISGFIAYKFAYPSSSFIASP